MARARSKTLTDGELRIMDVVWRLGSASVQEVTDALAKPTLRKGAGAQRKLAYNTVQTMLGILAEKGYLKRHKEGRAFVYQPLVSRMAARAEAVAHLTQSFFGGSKAELLHSLVEQEPIDAAEIEELRLLLQKHRVISEEGEP